MGGSIYVIIVRHFLYFLTDVFICTFSEAINIDIRLKFDLKTVNILEIFSSNLIEAF